MRILDRYILKSFLVNYLLALCVLVGMYVLLDVIVNIQDFTKGATSNISARASAWKIGRDMFDYYLYQFPVIFQMVSGIIPLVAAGFTMVRMTRHNELTAMLASGVNLYRVAAPIILVSMAFSALHIINQEFIISQPYVIAKLLRKQDEVNVAPSRHEPLMFIKDTDGSLLSARDYDPDRKLMTSVFIVERDSAGTPIRHTLAASAQWLPDPTPGATGHAWVMTDVTTEDDTGRQPDASRLPTAVRRTKLNPEQIALILSRKEVDYLSSARVHELATFSPEINRPLLYKIMHLRFTQPLMNVVMLLIGIPFLLTREPNRLVVNMFYCMAVSGFVFVGTFVLFQMGGSQLNPLWAAWLPVIIFGPFSLVMLDTVKT